MKLRTRLVVLVTVLLLFAALTFVPRIIDAKRSSAATAPANVSYALASPVQGRRQEITTGVSIRNDTSPPLRDMKQHPIGGGKEKREANENPKIAHYHKDTPDRVVQKTIAAPTVTV